MVFATKVQPGPHHITSTIDGTGAHTYMYTHSLSHTCSMFKKYSKDEEGEHTIRASKLAFVPRWHIFSANFVHKCIGCPWIMMSVGTFKLDNENYTSDPGDTFIREVP